MAIRKFDAKLRKIGNSFVVTVPKGSIERFKLEEGDYLAISFDSDEVEKNKSKKTKK